MKETLQRAFLLVFLLFSWQSWSQERSISGSVADENGLPLPGVTVQVKDASIGAVTDFDGNFSLSVPDNPQTTLVFSFIGYERQEVQIGSRSDINIVLNESQESLDAVVVTALGIRREEKRLGFSQTTVQTDELNHAPPNNWSSGVWGKVAGFNIACSGSGPLDPQHITLRGNNSLNTNG